MLLQDLFNSKVVLLLKLLPLLLIENTLLELCPQ